MEIFKIHPVFPSSKIKSYEESKILGLKKKKVRMSLGPIQLAVEYS
jgi:hypothetical protein